MKVLKRKVLKNGVYYTDFFLGWVRDGKACALRIAPSFMQGNRVLYAIAEDVPPGATLRDTILK